MNAVKPLHSMRTMIMNSDLDIDDHKHSQSVSGVAVLSAIGWVSCISTAAVSKSVFCDLQILAMEPVCLLINSEYKEMDSVALVQFTAFVVSTAIQGCCYLMLLDETKRHLGKISVSVNMIGASHNALKSLGLSPVFITGASPAWPNVRCSPCQELAASHFAREDTWLGQPLFHS